MNNLADIELAINDIFSLMKQCVIYHICFLGCVFEMYQVHSIIAGDIHISPKPWHNGWETWSINVYSWCAR